MTQSWHASFLRLEAEVQSLIPSGLVVVVGSEEPRSALFADELEATATWTPHRKLQFAIGRACSRQALQKMGQAPMSILFDDEGAPTWPTGFVGSISHKRQFCISVAGRADTYSAVGIDLERDARDRGEDELVRRTCNTRAEIAQALALRTKVASPGTMFLAAKEAFFKAQFPRSRQRLAWEDVEVSFESRAFTAVSRGLGLSITGTFAVSDGWMAAVCHQSA